MIPNNSIEVSKEEFLKHCGHEIMVTRDPNSLNILSRRMGSGDLVGIISKDLNYYIVE